MLERKLIASIEELLGSRGARVVGSIGDDAAVVRAAAFAVTSIDTVVEGVHFDLSTHDYADVGHKALATALSDLAAMGAEAGEAYVALILPAGTPLERGCELVRAMEALAERLGVTIAGGDVTAGPALIVSVAVTGWADDERSLVHRDGARPGDLVGVSGELGGAGAGLLLLHGARAGVARPAGERLIARHLRPEARLELGRELARAGASSMIDVSDGIATDAAHLAARSGVRLSIELERLPLAAGVAEVARAAGREPGELGATAGDDYELLVAVPPGRRAEVEAIATRTPVTWIGEVSSGSGVRMLAAGGRPVDLDGYEHEL